ncbi:MAG: LysR family transcriptional regulator, partial [Peptococcaceae bacterium]|nr:LysR family transcriptional regulator [Peptococcaceae bacterium]
MRIEKLKCLLDIAQTGSISATAQRLYISQQAVSKNIKHLEQELGVEVLVRTKTGVFLTEAGRLVVDFAKKFVAEEAVLQQQLALLKLEEEKKDTYIEIWATSSVTKMVLPEVLAGIQMLDKKISVNLLQINDYDSIVQQVLTGENILGLMTINEQVLYTSYPELE